MLSADKWPNGLTAENTIAADQQAEWETRNAANLRRLAGFVDLAEGFTLGLVELTGAIETDWLLAALAAQPRCAGVDWVIYPAQRETQFLLTELRDWLARLPIDPNRKRVVVVRDLERAIGLTADRPLVLLDLNFVRDGFRQSVPHPLLIVLPNDAMRRLARFAPDFWAWQSGLFVLESRPPVLTPLPDREWISPTEQRQIEERQVLLQQLLSETLPNGRAHDQQAAVRGCDLLAQLAELRLLVGDGRGAIELAQAGLETAIAFNQFNAIVYHQWLLGRADHQLRETDQAAQWLTQALAGAEAAGDSAMIVAILLDLGDVAVQQRDEKAARLAYRRCYGLAKETRNSYFVAHSAMRWALLEQRLGAIDQARSLMQVATQERPTKSVFWQAWALMEKEQGQIDRARELFAQAFACNPRDGMVCASLAKLEAQRSNWAQALIYADRAISAKHKKELYRRRMVALRAKIHMALGNSELASADFRYLDQALQTQLAQQPHNVALMVQRAQHLIQWGQCNPAKWAEAATLLTQAQKLASHSPRQRLDVLNAQGELALAQGDRHSAIAYWDSALRHDSTFAPARQNRDRH